MSDSKVESADTALFCGEVADKYEELTKIFVRHGEYLAAHKCQQKAEDFRKCKTLLEVRKVQNLNEF